MAETTQGATRSSKCHNDLYLSAIVGFAFFCFAASATVVVLSVVLLCPECSLPADTSLVNIYWGAAILLFHLGVMTVGLLIYHKRRQNRTSRVVISSIPAEDLEKSPAPTLPYNQVPRRQPFVQVSSIDYTALDLPDYATAVQNIDGVYSSMNAEVLTEDDPETPPPCYEQALEMATLVTTTNEANAYFSNQAVFTQEMDKSGEIFV